MHRKRPTAIVGLLLVVGLTAGCSVAATKVPTTSAGPTSRIEVKLTDGLRIEPATLAVRPGATVTFVVTNTGRIEHEFQVGDAAAQEAHEREMAAKGTMVMDEPGVIGVKPGQTKELTYTFGAAGTVYAGCHVPGHYGAGMRATITVG